MFDFFFTVNAKLFQVPETLPAEVLEKMHAPPKAAVIFNFNYSLK
jgi:hypothetical protein